ncbi:MAG: acetyltransferase [Lentisphaeria bacterium]|nr:acetyltransferase [Lentisphaeria bacterium]
MNNPTVIIYGASQFARVITHLIEDHTNYQIIGYLDDRQNTWGDNFMNKRILGGSSVLDETTKRPFTNVVIGFGDTAGRWKLTNELEKKGVKFLSIMHPDASVSRNVVLGEGSIVQGGVAIDPYVNIGKNVLLNKNTNIGHDTSIGDGCHIASGACLAAKCYIGSGTMIGMNASILSGVKIGQNSLIGAGAVVTKNIPDKAVAWGSPAKVHKFQDPIQENCTQIIIK